MSASTVQGTATRAASHGMSASKTFFETLANEKRFTIIQFLKDTQATVSDVTDALGYEQSVVSRHLRRLEACGFVTAERRGKERVYTLNKETIEPLMRLVEKHINTYCVRACLKTHHKM